MKLDTRVKQIEQIEKFKVQYKKIHGKVYPKILIENTVSGYIVWGYDTKDSKREEVVTLCDCGDMDYFFFKDNVLGPVGYYLGASDDDIGEFCYSGRVRTRSVYSESKDGGKYI